MKRAGILVKMVLATAVFCTAMVAYIGMFKVDGAKAAGDLEAYTGEVKHIFVHSLILDPEKAFRSPKKNGYNDWMTTKDEFKKSLSLLYENGYMLVDIHALVTKNEDGTLSKNTLYLPAGKKPLVLSVDDVNYYDYMKGHGFAERLTVDAEGQVTTVVLDAEGKETLDDEGDVVPILDAFIKENPDFSLNGAKGILAVTGYEGVFGYRITTTEGAEKEKQTAQAKKVAAALQKTGWRIASHSYTHTQKFRDGSITVERLTEELDRWEASVGAVVGQTNIFISPFGMHLNEKDARLDLLVARGYYIYCPVDSKMPTYYGKNALVQGRLNLDGFTMQRYPERIAKHFFDPALVLDGTRPTPAAAEIA